MKLITILLLLLTFTGCQQAKEEPLDFKHFVNRYLDDAVDQYKFALSEYAKDTLIFPRSVEGQNPLPAVNIRDWTVGFFPGSLWMLYEHSGDKEIEANALKYTRTLEVVKNDNSSHDLGFMLYNSYGQGYRLSKDSTFRDVLIKGAYTLVARFDQKVGCIKSWDWGKEDRGWKFPVIVDNMMNLELLMWAFNETKDSTFYTIAVSHADATLRNHFRNDNSSYHVVDYDPETGEVRRKMTVQGYDDESVWSRGQAWGFYGFTLMYRFTNDQ